METLKCNVNLASRYIVCLIMVFFVHISFITIFSMASTENIGYDVHVLDEKTGEYEVAYTHYFKDGDDLKIKEYEDNKIPFEKVNVRSDFEGAPYVTCLVISQAVSICIFLLIVPGRLRQFGDTDANRVPCGRMKEDVLRGLKLSIGPLIINIASYVMLLLNKFGIIGDFGLAWFKLLNYHLFGYLQLIFGQSFTCSTIGAGALILALLPTLLTAVSAMVIYYIGYKRISFFEKLAYQKKK